MTIIFNIYCLVAALTCSWSGIRLWRNYKKSKNWQLKNYSLGFLFISLAYIILSLPKLILFDPFWVQITFILVDLSFLGAELFLVSPLLSFSKKFIRFQKKSFQFFLSIIVIYIFLNIFFFSPALPLITGATLDYWENGVSWLHSLVWIPICLAAFGLGIYFLFQVKNIKEKILFWRSLFIGLGAITVSIAGFLFWYFKFFNPLIEILNISGIVGDLGFTFGLIGIIFFQPLREVFVKKIT